MILCDSHMCGSSQGTSRTGRVITECSPAGCTHQAAPRPRKPGEPVSRRREKSAFQACPPIALLPSQESPSAASVLGPHPPRDCELNLHLPSHYLRITLQEAVTSSRRRAANPESSSA